MVVGGGLVGASLAYELVSAGAGVTVVDRHDPGRATDAGAGILSPETNQDPDPDTFAFGMAAARHHQSLAERLRADGATDTGLAEAVDPADAAGYFPPLGPVHRALHSPVARRVDGRVLAGALRAAAEARGARWLGSSAVGVELDRTRRVATGVVTPDGSVPAGAVVIAGGAWSPELGRAFATVLPVEPLKGQIVHLRLPDVDSSAWTIVQPLLSFYLVPWPDGRVACGGTMEAAAGFDHRVTAEGMLQLLGECLRTAPGLAGATVTEVRVGSRPATPDQRPVLGRLPEWENAYVATGHGAEGLLLGPLSARMVAGAVLGVDEPDHVHRALADQVLAATSPGRFAGSS